MTPDQIQQLEQRPNQWRVNHADTESMQACVSPIDTEVHPELDGAGKRAGQPRTAGETAGSTSSTLHKK